MSTYSPDLRIELIDTGTQAGTWGNTTNTNLGTIIEDAISGYVSVSVTSAAQALTALNGAADQARNASIRLTTTTSANFAVYAPPSSKQYVVWNDSAYTATIYNSTVIGNTTAAGTGVAIPAGAVVTVWSNGTNFAFQNSHLASLTLATDLAVADGGTGASTASAARTNLGLAIGTDIPSTTGTGASGTWAINISGNAATATSASSATTATNATNAANLVTTNYTIQQSGSNLLFKYSGVDYAALTSAGNFGVGTNAPTYKLTVDTGATYGGALLKTDVDYVGFDMRVNGVSGSTAGGTYVGAQNEQGVYYASLALDIAADASSTFTATTTPAGSRSTRRDVSRLKIDGNGNFTSTIPGGTTLLPDFRARAWVNFDGTNAFTPNPSTSAIRGSGNVSSITDNGVGDYTANFTTAMPDVNYATVIAANGGASDTRYANLRSQLTTSVQVGQGSGIDRSLFCIAVFR